jgi:hypothetical protein
MTTTIFKKIEPHDLNPELRSWKYDDFGNRVDKKTGEWVIITDAISVPKQADKWPDAAIMLNEYGKILEAGSKVPSTLSQDREVDDE